MVKGPKMVQRFGGKSATASLYPQPIHDTIIEPFAGGAAYSLFGDNWRRRVILIEKDPRLVQVWRWLKSASKKEIQALPIPDPGTDVRNLKSLSAPARLFLGLWIGQPTDHFLNYVTDWTHWTPAARDMVADNIGKIKKWKILEGDYSIAPDIQGTWFIDPPYKSAKYGKYHQPILDYEKLAAWCKSRAGQVIVCEGAGGDWLDFDHFKLNKTTARKNFQRSGRKEKIWYRKSSSARPGFDRLKDGGPGWVELEDQLEVSVATEIQDPAGAWRSCLENWSSCAKENRLEFLAEAWDLLNKLSDQGFDLVSGFLSPELDSLLENIARFAAVNGQEYEEADDLQLANIHGAIHKLAEVCGLDGLEENHAEISDLMIERGLEHNGQDWPDPYGEEDQEKRIEDWNEKIMTREALADQAHKSWSGWMEFLFTRGKFNPDGSFTIDPEAVQRWQRQRLTGYQDLSEQEKESDRLEADKYIAIIEALEDQEEAREETDLNFSDQSEEIENDPADDPKVGPRIFPYFGSKARLIFYYPRPIYDTIIEPFSGSATFSLYGNNPEKKVILIDKDPELCELWRWLIKCRPSDILKIPIPEPGSYISDIKGISEIQKEFLRRWAFSKGKQNKWSELTKDGLKHRSWSETRRKKISEIVSRIKHWKIIEGDYNEAPDIQGTWFIDPPYERKDHGTVYKENSDQINFDDLADWIKSRKGQIIVCGSSGCKYLDFENFKINQGFNYANGSKKQYFEKIWYRPDTGKRSGFDPEKHTPWIYAADETETIKISDQVTEAAELACKKEDQLKLELANQDFNAVLQAHFRGRSAHSDLRILNSYGVLEGWTLNDADQAKIQDPVLEVGIARKLAADPEVFLFRPGGNWIRVEKKYDNADIDWLEKDGAIIPPGEPGATSVTPAVIVDRARGKAWPGVNVPGEVAEYFLDLDNGIKGRAVFSALPDSWAAVMPLDQTPLVLKSSSENLGYIPPAGRSALPPELEEKVPDGLRWWVGDKSQERKLRDIIETRKLGII